MYSRSKGTVVERELFKAKESLSFLNGRVSEAERGGVIEFDKLLGVLSQTSHAMQQLSEGKIPAESIENVSSGARVVTSQGLFGGTNNRESGSTSFSMNSSNVTRVGYTDSTKFTNSVPITELQRRRAQQVLSELRLLDEVLRRQQAKHEQLEKHKSGINSLLENSLRGVNKGSITYDDLGYLSKEESRLKHVRQQMEQMHVESQAVLDALKQQSSRLSGVGDKIADIIASIGVSNTAVLQIVRRNQLDAWLVYGGIILLVIIMWYVL